MAAVIPESHKYLLENPIHAALTTIMPDGQPQSTVVWLDYKDGYVRVNSVIGRRKDRNVRADPRVTILLVDPQDPYRWMEIRGRVVEIIEEGAVDHIDLLARRYTDHPYYYGGVVPASRRDKETRVIYLIEPIHVTAYAD